MSRIVYATAALVAALMCGEKKRGANPSSDSIPIAKPLRAGAVGSDSIVKALIVDGTRWRLDSTMTLALAQATLGPARIHQPKHHDDPAWLCYRVRLRSDSLYLVLKSDAMGTRENWLGGFELTRSLPEGVLQTDCATTDKAQSIITDNGLFIGMPINELLAIMHAPKEQGKGQYRFEFYRVVRPIGARPYEQSGTLEVSEVAARVTRLAASYAERA